MLESGTKEIGGDIYISRYIESGPKEIGGGIYISPPISFGPLSTMAQFKGKKSSFFLNIILEKN